MKSTTEKVFDSFDYKTKKELPSAQDILGSVLSLIIGFSLAYPYFAGEFSPFQTSFSVVLPKKFGYFAIVGSIIGDIIFYGTTASLKYISALVTVFIISVLIKKTVPEKYNDIANAISVFACQSAVGFTVLLATGFSAQTLTVFIFEAVISAAAIPAMGIIKRIIEEKKFINRINYFEMFCVIFFALSFFAPLTDFGVELFYPARAVILCALLIFCCISDMKYSLVAGLSSGIILGLFGENGYMGIFLPLAYFLASYAFYEKKNKFFSSALFVTVIACAAVFSADISFYAFLVEGTFAAVIFCFIPNKFIKRISSYFDNTEKKQHCSVDNSSDVRNQLSNAGDALKNVSDCIEKVQKTLNPLTTPSAVERIEKARKSVCDECKHKDNCAEKIQKPSNEFIERAASFLKNGRSIPDDIFSDEFKKSCFDYQKMLSSFKECSAQYAADLTAGSRIAEIQAMMSEEYKSLADILSDISQSIAYRDLQDDELSKLCISVAEECGMEVISGEFCYLKNTHALLRLVVSTPGGKFDISSLTENLSEAVGVKLDIPEVKKQDGLCELLFHCARQFTVQTGIVGKAFRDNRVCGDFYHCFTCNNLRYIVLSDGMGTGSRAAVDSAMTAELFSRLIKSGFSADCAFKIVNSALLIKSEDESLATLDVCIIDLCTGEAEFLKAGAAATFLKRDDKITVLEQSSLPVGILRETELVKAHIRLKKGDKILLVSDGILSDGNNWLIREFRNSTSSFPKELASEILSDALDRVSEDNSDDMTVIAVEIK